jgi:archaellum component FlaF (FlaF/FlaG flagellin family)
MENIFVSIVCLAVLLLGTGTLALGSFNSADAVVYAIKDQESQSVNILQTSLSTVSTSTYSAGTMVDIYLENTGQIALYDYSKWDVIVRYENGTVMWLPYGSATPGWSVGGITIDGRPEVFNPQIFDPAEILKLTLKMQPAVSDNSTNVATISTPYGVTAEAIFGH